MSFVIDMAVYDVWLILTAVRLVC